MLPAWYRYLVRIHSQKTVPLRYAAGFQSLIPCQRIAPKSAVESISEPVVYSEIDPIIDFSFLGTSDEKYPSVSLGTSVLVYLPTVCVILIKTFVLHVTIVALQKNTVLYISPVLLYPIKYFSHKFVYSYCSFKSKIR